MTTRSSTAPLLDRARIAELAEKLEPDLLRGFLLEAVIEAETARRRLADFAVQLEEAGRVAHRLRGTSLNLGLARVGGLAAAIEADAEQNERLAALIEELGEAVVATREAAFRLHIVGMGGRSLPPRGRAEASSRDAPAAAAPGPPAPPAAGAFAWEGGAPVEAAPSRPARTEPVATGRQRQQQPSPSPQQRATAPPVDGQQTAINLFVDGVHGFAALPDGVVKFDLYEDRVDYEPAVPDAEPETSRRRHIVARLTMTRVALGRMLYRLATTYRTPEK